MCAFVAATLDALPRMADRRVGAGRQLRPGLAPWLSGVLGGDAFDDGNEHRRLAPFLEHGGRTAAEFRTAWERGVERAAAVPHDGSQPSESPWEWPIEMAGLAAGSFSTLKQTQRTLTFHCEQREHAQLDLEMRALPRGDEQRWAFLNCDRNSLIWTQCVAQDKYVNSNLTFCLLYTSDAADE